MQQKLFDYVNVAVYVLHFPGNSVMYLQSKVAMNGCQYNQQSKHDNQRDIIDCTRYNSFDQDGSHSHDVDC